MIRSLFISLKMPVSVNTTMNLLDFKLINYKFYKSRMTAIHEDAAMAHTLGVLRYEDAHGDSHDAKCRSCRDLISGE